MKAVTLFAGAGGSCQGLKDAGLDVVACFERDDDAVATLKANGLPAIQADLVDYDWSPYAGKIDLVEGGPPCQPFSAAGLGQGEWDARDCIPAYIDAVAAIRPRFFVMENVRGLTFKKHREYLETVVTMFRELGYNVEWRVLNAADFGVPQTRQRLFVVGRLDGEAIQWPEPTHSKAQWVTMADALGWDGAAMHIPRGSGMRERHGERPDHSMDKPAPTIRDKVRCATWQPRKRIEWPVLPDTVSLQRRQNGAPPIDACAQPAPTVTVTVTAVATGQWEVTWPHERPSTTVAAAADGRIGRPGHKDWSNGGESQFAKDAVKVTPEEAAILQDFRPDWEFVGSRSSRFRQIGNACPRRLTQAVVQALLPQQVSVVTPGRVVVHPGRRFDAGVAE